MAKNNNPHVVVHYLAENNVVWPVAWGGHYEVCGGRECESVR